MDVYVWIITICACYTFVQTHTCKYQKKKCAVRRVYNMKGADCYDKDLEHFTQCLPNDVEIIDLSRNRIRKLKKTDLMRYSSVKMLYLSDNFLVAIDDETFEGQDYLMTLDLSENALTKLPPALFQLPSLQSLYLGRNLNINIVETIEQAKPIKSPLFHLDISYIMSEEPGALPPLGVLAYLEKYNISGNRLVFTTASDFAGLCNLKILDTTNVTVEFENECDCWTINRWLRSRRVQFKAFSCNIRENDCVDKVSDEDVQIYERCKKIIEEDQQKAKIKTTLLIVLPIVFVVIVPGILYILYRRRKRQKQRQTKNNNQESHLVPRAKLADK